MLAWSSLLIRNGHMCPSIINQQHLKKLWCTHLQSTLLYYSQYLESCNKTIFFLILNYYENYQSTVELPMMSLVKTPLLPPVEDLGHMRHKVKYSTMPLKVVFSKRIYSIIIAEFPFVYPLFTNRSLE